jgi:hypothetical protein
MTTVYTRDDVEALLVAAELSQHPAVAACPAPMWAYVNREHREESWVASVHRFLVVFTAHQRATAHARGAMAEVR